MCIYDQRLLETDNTFGNELILKRRERWRAVRGGGGGGGGGGGQEGEGDGYHIKFPC